MPPRVVPGPVHEDASIREAVCVHTSKIFDACKDKDCLEDLRVYLTAASQDIVNNATSVRAKAAELLFCGIDVEPVTFNRGCYTIDVRYFYKITGEANLVGCNCAEICGLAMFNKRVILFGSEGGARTFSSDVNYCCVDQCGCGSRANLPTAIVESVDPIVLGMKLIEVCPPCNESLDMFEIPSFVAQTFGANLIFDPMPRRVYVTLGQFSIIRLERETNLVVPSYDYCIPDKECPGSEDGDPCSLFESVDFPVDEFYPPNSLCAPEGYREAKAAFGC